MALCKQCEYWVGNGATPNISKIVCMVPEDYREVCPSFKRVKGGTVTTTLAPDKPVTASTYVSTTPPNYDLDIIVMSGREYEDETDEND